MLTIALNLKTRSMLAIMFAVFLFAGNAACQTSSVTAELRQDGATSIILAVTVQNPAPASLIGRIRLSPGTAIVSVEPPSARISTQTGTVKWLVKNVRPGTLRLRVRTQNPQSLSSVSGDVQFRNAGSGHVVTIPAH